MKNLDENYRIRRKIASIMSDNDILSAVLELNSIMQSLSDKGSDKIGFLDNLIELFKVDKEQIIDIAIKEAKNAIIPFLDEMDDRHKN